MSSICCLSAPPHERTSAIARSHASRSIAVNGIVVAPREFLHLVVTQRALWPRWVVRLSTLRTESQPHRQIFHGLCCDLPRCQPFAAGTLTPNLFDGALGQRRGLAILAQKPQVGEPEMGRLLGPNDARKLGTGPFGKGFRSRQPVGKSGDDWDSH